MTRRILAVFPHPDDESYTAAGTLAQAAAAGVEVHLLCATHGERGQILDPSLATPATLATVRAQELATACQAIGARPPRFLGYHDGELDRVDLPEAVGAIVQMIRAVRPQVVITLGADGVYGHPDHIALHKLVTPAFRAAGGGDRFPEDRFGPAWQPARLFWTAFPRGHFRPVWERLLSTDLAEGVRRLSPEQLGTDAGQVDLAVDVRGFIVQKLAAMAAHRTQLTAGDPLSIFPPGVLAPLLGTERFTLAEGQRPQAPLTGLFDGLA